MLKKCKFNKCCHAFVQIFIKFNTKLLVSSPGLSSCTPRSKLEALTPPLSSAMDNEQPCDLRLLTPATCLRELANASSQQQRELMAVAAGELFYFALNRVLLLEPSTLFLRTEHSVFKNRALCF